MGFILRTSLFVITLVLSGIFLAWVDADMRMLKKLDKQISKVIDVNGLERKEIAPPQEQIEEERSFYQLVLNDSLVGYAVLSRSYGCRVGGCAAYSSSTEKNGNYDPFYFSIITDANFIIKNVKVLAFYSEHGYQITSKKWLAQFIGRDGQNLEYDKDVDAISGATISVQSMIDDVEAASKSLQTAAKQI